MDKGTFLLFLLGTQQALSSEDVKLNLSVAGNLGQFSVFIDGINITLPLTHATSNVDTTLRLAFKIDPRLSSSHLITVTTSDGRSDEIEIVLSFESDRQENVLTSEIGLNIQNVDNINVHVQMDHVDVNQSFRFLSNPGNVYVLEKTRATLNWTIALAITSDVADLSTLVNIAWRYLGTLEQPKCQELMVYMPEKHYVWPRNKHDRVGYLEYPGSVAMTIDNVTKSDRGDYEVSVASTKRPGRRVLRGLSALRIVQVSDIYFDIALNDKIYPIRVNVSGVNVTLQTVSNLTVPGYIELSVTYPLSVPRPHVAITHSGNPKKTMTCEGLLRCDKGIFLHEWYAEEENFMIHLVLDFKIQNFDKVSVRLPIALHRKSTPDRPGGVSIFTFMGIVFLVSSVCAIIQVFVIDR